MKIGTAFLSVRGRDHFSTRIGGVVIVWVLAKVRFLVESMVVTRLTGPTPCRTAGRETP